MAIYRKKPADLARIHASCQVVYQVQQALVAAIAPGVTTLELDRLAEEIIRTRAGRPAFKGYHGFPGAICASVNEEVVHGFPNQRPLQPGDLLTVDVGVELEGFFGDGAFTCGVGTLSGPAQHLLDTTRACLEAGIGKARAGGRLSDISHAVQTCAEAAGTAVVRQYGGHGIGRALHEDPHLANYGPPGRGPRLQPGLVLAIEPILSLGTHQVEADEDGWTTRTCDGSLAAHFEHTVAITEAGPWVLTLPEEGPRWKVTLLGTGTSSGVPRIGCDCAVCLSADPRNKRLRCSLLVEASGGHILVDTSPDLRLQALSQGLRQVDAVLFTHPHVDHLYGLDELRSFCFNRDAPIPCYGDQGTLDRIERVFDYAFKPVYKNMKESVPHLSLHLVDGPFEVCGCLVEPVAVYHGRLPVLGYRFGSFAYVTDCNAIPPATLGRLRGLEVLVLDALRHKEHPTHFTVAQALEVVAELRPRRAYFTHIAHDLDHQTTNAGLPPGVELAYDGLTLEFA